MLKSAEVRLLVPDEKQCSACHGYESRNDRLQRWLDVAHCVVTSLNHRQHSIWESIQPWNNYHSRYGEWM